MNREAQSILLLLVGGAVLRISLFSDVYLRYVKEGLRPFLVVAGVLLVVIGAATLWRELFGSGGRGRRRSAAPTLLLAADGDGGDLPAGAGSGSGDRGASERADGPPAGGHTVAVHGPGGHGDVDLIDDDDDDDGHGHGHGGSRVAWLLTLPVLAVFLIGPPPLGSYSASRQGSAAVAEPSSDFPPLPRTDPAQVTVLDYATRAIWDRGASLGGRRVALRGFVSRGPGGEVYLTRIILTCCAADGRAIRVSLTGEVPADLAADTWIRVVGTYDPRSRRDATSGEAIPSLRVTSVERIAEPKEPYET